MPERTTAATLILESRYLRASLRIEVEAAHPPFFVESHLSDSRTAAEELLPAALATAAPPMLRQILEEVEGLLLRRSTDDLAQCTSEFAELERLARRDGPVSPRFAPGRGAENPVTSPAVPADEQEGRAIRHPYSSTFHSCSCGASRKDDCTCSREASLSNTASASSGVALSSKTD